MRVRRGALAGAAVWHLGGWLAQVGETWLVLRLLGRTSPGRRPWRSRAWPPRRAARRSRCRAGIGVQEGALVVVCAAFGVVRPSALALGIIKRGRELLVGAPAIVAWAIAERHAHRQLLEEEAP